MTLGLAATILAIFVLILLSAFFSGSETSLTAASKARMHTLESEGDKRASLVVLLLAEKERLIGAILLGNNLVNIMASALATGLFIAWFGETGILYATLVMTALVLIFAEVLPKTYAINNAERMARAVAPIMRPIVFVLAPITRAIQAIVQGTLTAFGVQLREHLSIEHALAELRGAIDLHAGHEDRDERHMLRSILDLTELTVEEIMTHRRDIEAINLGQPNEAIIEQVIASNHTRLPLWSGSSENIVGVLHAKALLRAVRANASNLESLDIAEIANDPWFIPESTDLLAQLRAFRTRREHLAIVVDEYGEFLGLVTLEDILEEIVGEIEDEHDEELSGVELESDGRIVVDGKVTLRDLNRRFDWRLPDEEAATLAGLVLHEARRIPEVGQVYLFHGFRFEILGRERHQVTQVAVTPMPGAETESQDVEGDVDPPR